jgi:arylsulfatase A-like enzyme
LPDALASAAGLSKEGAEPLNVLFINTDQQRADALSCAGSPYVHTPNLDRLAREGVRFSYAFTPQPECVPARSCFHSGQTVHTSGCTINTKIDAADCDFRAGSYDQQLARQGYKTEYHGRWHGHLSLTDCYANEVSEKFTVPYRRHLDYILGPARPPGPGEGKSIISGRPYTMDLTQEELKDTPHAQFNCQYGVYSLPTRHTFTGWTGETAVEAIRRYAGEPFSITAAFLSPHHPWYVPEQFAGSISPDTMDLPATMHHDRANTLYVQNGWQLDEVELRNMKLFRARYFELVAEVDFQVGRILRALDDLGIADRTLVVFCADHGEMLGDHALTQKFVPYQESVRVPLLMRLPGVIPAGTVIAQPVNTVDIPATVMDYLGIAVGEMDGQSLRPLIEGRNTGRTEYTFSELGWAEPARWSLIASHEWKYVWYPYDKAPDLLFDLEADPHEINNLLGTNPDRARYLPQAKRLRQELLDWMESLKHPLLERCAASELG